MLNKGIFGTMSSEQGLFSCLIGILLDHVLSTKDFVVILLALQLSYLAVSDSTNNGSGVFCRSFKCRNLDADGIWLIQG